MYCDQVCDLGCLKRRMLFKSSWVVFGERGAALFTSAEIRKELVICTSKSLGGWKLRWLQLKKKH